MNGPRFGIVIAAAWVLALLYAVYQGGSLAWHLIACLSVLIALAALTQAGPLRAIRIERTMRSGPYTAGEALNVTLSVASGRRWPWPYLLVIDNLPPELEVSAPRFVVSHLGRGWLSLTYRIPSLKRGVYDLADITLQTGDALGLFRRTRDIPMSDSLVVWPATVPLDSSRLLSHIWHGDNRSPQPTRLESAHIRGIREYVPGDRLSRVHWKTSAHTGDFKVKQFEPDTDPEFTVLLDHRAHFSLETWELAISVAASLVRQAYRGHKSIGLSAADLPEATLSPAFGPAALAAMMNFLSELPHNVGGSARLTHARLPSRAVVITTTQHADGWLAFADQVVAIGPGGIQSLEDLQTYVAFRGGQAGAGR